MIEHTGCYFYGNWRRIVYQNRLMTSKSVTGCAKSMTGAESGIHGPELKDEYLYGASRAHVGGSLHFR
jgi:hypothetical protein